MRDATVHELWLQVVGVRDDKWHPYTSGIRR
jgi:hypothetical protein